MSYLPVSVPSGDFTPGAQASLEFAAALINASWEQANLKNAAFETKIGDAQGELPDISTTVADLHITAGSASGASVVEPSITIADTSATDVYDDFETQYLALVDLLATKFSTFQASYFPDDTTFYAQTEDWLQAVLADSSGLPTATRAQLLGDAQATILTESNRAKDAVLATFATRRMPMPGGQAASAVLQIEQGAQDKMAAAARDITKLSIDNLKFAVEKAINCRTVAMSSAIDYIKALASGPDMASRLVNVGYDAQSKMISSAAQWFNARTDVAKVANQVSQFNVTTALQADEKNQATDVTMIETKIKTLLAESQALAQMATSMYNNLHASAGTSYGVNGT